MNSLLHLTAMRTIRLYLGIQNIRLLWVCEMVIIFMGLVVLTSFPPSIYGDGGGRYNALIALIRDGHISAVKYSMIGSMFSIPLWFVGGLFHSSDYWVARFNFLIFSFGLVALFFLLRKKISPRFARIFIILLIYSSMFPHHIQAYYGEVFTAVFVAVGIALASVSQCNWQWLLIILGAANTPSSVGGLALVCLRKFFGSKQMKFIVFLGLFALVVLGENWIRRGHPLTSGYEGDHGYATQLPYSGLSGFSYPFFLGVLSIILSFGKGLIFFVPGAFLPLMKRMRSPFPKWLYDCYLSWILYLVGLVLVYAKFWSWYGGWFWGPRFFLFASFPAALVLTIYLLHEKRTLIESVLLLVVLTLSFWVGLDGLLFGQQNMGICMEHNYQVESFCWFVPEFSALWVPFVSKLTLHRHEWATILIWVMTYVYLAIPVWIHLLRDLLNILGKNFGYPSRASRRRVAMSP